MVRTFEDLECWKQGAELRKKLSQVIKGFPSEEKYRLVDQIYRSTRSVTANIAEGYGRYHYQEYIQFCRQSRGSLYETLEHLIVACEEKYISEQQFSEFRLAIIRSIAVLNGFINYLGKAKTKENIIHEPEESYLTDIPTIND